ncbi:hypothetical protein M9H77_36457 [Catharanthus roseus]|uniref:Uncharacterized protein n=1 Tax=Catharanthus roseus TaxID=4058 RepID=A0ACB9ZRV2_CATRO|nr:hypothetical protein M9H77_36457 [Catharanthus roseus]
MKSREHKVTTYNPREEIYMVKPPIQVSGKGNNVYTLRLNNKSCNCEKWQTYTLPSHVLAVCRENRSRTDTYVPEIYSRETYRRTYQVNFHPVLSENFWRDETGQAISGGNGLYKSGFSPKMWQMSHTGT